MDGKGKLRVQSFGFGFGAGSVGGVHAEAITSQAVRVVGIKVIRNLNDTPWTSLGVGFWFAGVSDFRGSATFADF